MVASSPTWRYHIQRKWRYFCFLEESDKKIESCCRLLFIFYLSSELSCLERMVWPSPFGLNENSKSKKGLSWSILLIENSKLQKKETHGSRLVKLGQAVIIVFVFHCLVYMVRTRFQPSHLPCRATMVWYLTLMMGLGYARIEDSH
jgi:hypothetical protein